MKHLAMNLPIFLFSCSFSISFSYLFSFSFSFSFLLHVVKLIIACEKIYNISFEIKRKVEKQLLLIIRIFYRKVITPLIIIIIIMITIIIVIIMQKNEKKNRNICGKKKRKKNKNKKWQIRHLRGPSNHDFAFSLLLWILRARLVANCFFFIFFFYCDCCDYYHFSNFSNFANFSNYTFVFGVSDYFLCGNILFFIYFFFRQMNPDKELCYRCCRPSSCSFGKIK